MNGAKGVIQMYLRQYKKEDAKTILSWCTDEDTFRKWAADRYDHYPITEKDMNYKYSELNGDCSEPDNFYPMTACDDNGIVGHFILRYTGGDHRVLRIGFVIVDNKKRGCGYGRQMIRLALEYAFRIAGAERVTLGVFENNEPAYKCYKAAGFREVPQEQEEICELCGKRSRIIELETDKSSFLADG